MPKEPDKPEGKESDLRFIPKGSEEHEVITGTLHAIKGLQILEEAGVKVNVKPKDLRPDEGFGRKKGSQ